MPIEFTCPGCTSRHACAEHMAGRQFRCNGCGKILTVPGASGEAISERPRSTSADHGETYAEAQERGAGMGSGLQMAVIVIGGGLLLLLLVGFCLGFGLWLPRHLVAPPGPPAAFDVKEETVPTSPVEEGVKDGAAPKAAEKQ
jgi:hypothetical protein